MLVADGLGQAGAGAGAAEPEDQVGGEEQGRPAGTEPTGEERSNKLRVKFYQFNGQSLDTSAIIHTSPPSHILIVQLFMSSNCGGILQQSSDE